MANTKLYEHYKLCRKLEAIETVMGIIVDRNEGCSIEKGSPDAVTMEYLIDLHNDMEKQIWLDTEHLK